VNYIDERRTRVSAESAYLTEDVLARPNLVVTLHGQVTKILFDNGGQPMEQRSRASPTLERDSIVNEAKCERKVSSWSSDASLIHCAVKDAEPE
jgi:choline dehydrogenase